MMDNKSIRKIKSEIKKGMQLAKCRKCACMRETLENLLVYLLSIKSEESSALIQDVNYWLKEMEPIKYTCLGCEHCFPAVATNILMLEFPAAELSSPGCAFEVKNE